MTPLLGGSVTYGGPVLTPHAKTTLVVLAAIAVRTVVWFLLGRYAWPSLRVAARRLDELIDDEDYDPGSYYDAPDLADAPRPAASPGTSAAADRTHDGQAVPLPGTPSAAGGSLDDRVLAAGHPDRPVAAWEGPAPDDDLARWAGQRPVHTILDSLPWNERLLLEGWDLVRQLDDDGWRFVHGEVDIPVPDPVEVLADRAAAEEILREWEMAA